MGLALVMLIELDIGNMDAYVRHMLMYGVAATTVVFYAISSWNLLAALLKLVGTFYYVFSAKYYDVLLEKEIAVNIGNAKKFLHNYKTMWSNLRIGLIHGFMGTMFLGCWTYLLEM
jgi:hypothetical protein